MLADGEDECVVYGKTVALGLGDVEVVALGMGRRMASHEIVRWVFARVDYGKGECYGVWVVLDGMLDLS